MTGIRYIIFINVGRSRPLVEAVQGDYTVENRMPVACNFAYNLIIFKIWDTEPFRFNNVWINPMTDYTMFQNIIFKHFFFGGGWQRCSNMSTDKTLTVI